jgi:acetyltransferase-like isoleucine patch superfamily enzyme
LLRLSYRIYKFLFYKILIAYSWVFGRIIFKVYKIKIGKNWRILGIPDLYVHKYGYTQIGNSLAMNSGKHFNQIGRQQNCIIQVGKNAKLIIGNNVGISCSAIICMKSIEIGDNVKIGGNVAIYDTDFHSLNPNDRIQQVEDLAKTKVAKVTISKNVFIGAHSIILKGVQIGENSIIGAGSVVTKNVPSNQIWGGNPACFIKEVQK